MESFWKDHSAGPPDFRDKKSVAQIARSDVKRFFEVHYRLPTPSSRSQAISGMEKYTGLQSATSLILKPALPRIRVCLPGSIRAAGSVTNRIWSRRTYVWGPSSPPLASEERFCAHLLSNILGGGMSSVCSENYGSAAVWCILFTRC